MFHHRAAHVFVSAALALAAGCAADAPAPGPAAPDADVAPTTDLVVSEVADVADATDIAIDTPLPDVPAVVDTVDVLDAVDAASDAVPDVPPDPCAGKNCDDGNACTTDACDGAGVCQHAPLGAGITCGTDKVCDVGSTCVEGYVGMVLIPAGTFWMGCNEVKDNSCFATEEPQHKVTLSAYYMDLTETTVAQYKACVDAGGCTVPAHVQPYNFATYPGFPNNPVNYVTWTQSEAYCKWRGVAFDLPTEAQWEMAARGSCEKNGSTAGDPGCAAAMRRYPWGAATASESYAVFNVASTAAVGSVPAGDSPYGVHDMAGNVWEWTRDWYSATYYNSSPAMDPFNSVPASYRVARGGCFVNVPGSNALGAGRRNYSMDANVVVGLRCVRSYP